MDSVNMKLCYESGAGITPMTQTSWQSTALDEARIRGFTEIRELLEDQLLDNRLDSI